MCVTFTVSKTPHQTSNLLLIPLPVVTSAVKQYLQFIMLNAEKGWAECSCVYEETCLWQFDWQNQGTACFKVMYYLLMIDVISWAIQNSYMEILISWTCLFTRVSVCVSACVGEKEKVCISVHLCKFCCPHWGIVINTAHLNPEMSLSVFLVACLTKVHRDDVRVTWEWVGNNDQD